MAAAAGHRFRSVAMYNYKGGVGKTTMTVNLSAALALEKKKVLIVDLDPQCNSTQFYKHGSNIIPLEAEENAVDRASENELQAAEAMAAARPVVLSDATNSMAEATPMESYVNMMEKTGVYRLFYAFLYEGKGLSGLTDILQDEASFIKCNEDTLNGNLWLLAGSPLLSQFEPTFTQAFYQNRPKPNDHMTIGLFAFLVRKAIEYHRFDVVIFDMGPSNSTMNMIAAISCDYILPPCNASIYSCGSIYGLLSHVLPGETGWLGEHGRVTRNQGTNNELVELHKPFLLPQAPPKLLPFFVTNYGIESENALHGGRRSNPFLKTPSYVSYSASSFITTMRQYVNHECMYIDGREPPTDFAGPQIKFELNDGRHVIPFVPSVPVSIAASEELGSPFVSLTIDHYYAAHNISPKATRELTFFLDKYGFNDLMEPLEGIGIISLDMLNKMSVDNIKDLKDKTTGKRFVKSFRKLHTALGKHQIKRRRRTRLEAEAELEENETLDKLFEAEVKVMKGRFQSLAKWIVHLVNNQ